MKTIISNILLISILLVIAGCSNVNEEIDNKTEGLLDCCPLSFKESYLENFPKDDVFFIKGIALDVYEYGRYIKVIEDLKGNFDNKSSIFVWGEGFPSEGFIGLESDRLDYITQYNKNDTLIMFLEKARKRFDIDIEKPGDYTTITGACSTIKLSNGYAIGHINSWWEEIETMLWKELQEELQALLNSTKETKP